MCEKHAELVKLIGMGKYHVMPIDDPETMLVWVGIDGKQVAMITMYQYTYAIDITWSDHVENIAWNHELAKTIDSMLKMVVWG